MQEHNSTLNGLMVFLSEWISRTVGDRSRKGANLRVDTNDGPSSLKDVVHYVPLTYCYWSRARGSVKAAGGLSQEAKTRVVQRREERWRHPTSDRIHRPFAKLMSLPRRPRDAPALSWHTPRVTFPLKKCQRDFPGGRVRRGKIRWAHLARWRIGTRREKRSSG